MDYLNCFAQLSQGAKPQGKIGKCVLRDFAISMHPKMNFLTKYKETIARQFRRFSKFFREIREIFAFLFTLIDNFSSN